LIEVLSKMEFENKEKDYFWKLSPKYFIPLNFSY
jgi:hypothetical protein